MIKTFFHTEQSSSASSCSSSDGKEKKKDITSFSTSDATLNAEIMWCLNVVMSHFSYNSCTELTNLFKVMFPDSELAAKFTWKGQMSRHVDLWDCSFL